MSSLKTAVDPAAWGAPGAGPGSNPAPPGPGPFPQKVTPATADRAPVRSHKSRQGITAGAWRSSARRPTHPELFLALAPWHNKEAKRKDGHIQAYRNGKPGG